MRKQSIGDIKKHFIDQYDYYTAKELKLLSEVKDLSNMPKTQQEELKHCRYERDRMSLILDLVLSFRNLKGTKYVEDNITEIAAIANR